MAMFRHKLKPGSKKKRIKECPKRNQKISLNYQGLLQKKVGILNNKY
jgi:hypothetical protein